MKKQFLSCALLMAMTSQIYPSFFEHAFFDASNVEDQWKFLEKKFITDIHTAKLAWAQYENYGIIAGMLGLGNAGMHGFTLQKSTPEQPAAESTKKRSKSSASAISYGQFWIDYVNSWIAPKQEPAPKKAIEPVIIEDKAVTKPVAPKVVYEDILKLALEPKNAYTILTVGTVLYMMHQLYESQTTSSTNYKAVADFFANWDENQSYCPKDIFEGFEIIAEMIENEGDEFIVNNADTIVDTIQFLIKRHFEKRYEKSLQVEAAFSLGDAKTITEIVKNSLENVGKFSGKK